MPGLFDGVIKTIFSIGIKLLPLVVLLILLKVFGKRFFNKLEQKIKRKKGIDSTEFSFTVERKCPLTKAEQRMYWLLVDVFKAPDFVVLSQVSMSALLDSDWKDRNRYAQKYVDFVVCSPSFFVLAVIELDDWSHDNKQDKDAERDAMLQSAGLNALRYRALPEPEKLRADVMQQRAGSNNIAKNKKI